MQKQYSPSNVESKIYQQWLDHKCFSAHEKPEGETYSIVIPPPNVTGILHMGHALNNTVQDILIRYKRMSGYATLWLPGTDHAGIATQNVVERLLASEGKTRHDLGREAFIDKVWEWKDKYHQTITAQLKRLGSSCDWDRERFTMDEGLSYAVRSVFVELYNKGLIYRGKYIINWCPRCLTALSDEEAEHREVKGKLWHFKYPFADSSGYVIVATTRPETMLGDTAVAVNPKDKRYEAMVGKTLILPLVNREIPIVADDFVNKEFGTGAVKVTPAHDPNDFSIGQRNAMEPVVVLDESGNMCGDIPQKYKGLDRFTARAMIVEDMQKEGLLVKTEDHLHAIGHCYRCHTMVEPYYSDQWFVKMKPLAQSALKAALDDRLEFFPSRWKKTYIEWMENIRDWCISRQIWWGHRIPVWYCQKCKEIIVAIEAPQKCTRCKSDDLKQDEDVLDTWFSSWLWPFSTMGWPENTELLKRYYPTNTLATAPEIIFFWVARMVMAGLYFTGKLPFTDVILHGTVRDKTGKKMSKSLGNAIDPLEIISTHGADALRFSLIMITAKGADVYLGPDTFDLGRNFANKLWNASRFLLGNINETYTFSGMPPLNKTEDIWIVSRLQKTIQDIYGALESYRFNDVCRTLYDFIWHDFCDWYIEAKKSDLYQNENADQKCTALHLCTYTLGTILKLLHPVMPFITEEIWQYIRENVSIPDIVDHEFIMMSSFPKADTSLIHNDIENQFELLQQIIVALRTIRSENNVPPEKKGTAVIVPENEETVSWLTQQQHLITLFARLDHVTISCTAQKPQFAGRSVIRGVEIFLSFEGLIDKNVEIERLTKEITHLGNMVTAAKKRLENKSFLEKAPADVVAREREKMDGMEKNLEKLQNNLAKLQK